MLFLELLKKYWKFFAGLLLALGLCIGSYQYGRKSVAPVIQVQEKIVEHEKIVTVEVEKKKTDKDITTTITKNTDGSSTTVVHEKEHTEQASSTKVAEEKTKETEKKSTPVITALTHYRLGAFLETDPLKLFDKPEAPTWGLRASTRIFSDAWIDASFNVKTKSTTLGLSWEW